MVSLNMVRIDVMSAMCALPGEIWSQQERVEDPSDAIIYDTILRESTVSAFMSVDPEAGPDDTLREAIEGHERIVEESIGLNNPWNCEEEETGHQS